jgi:hypothetical protein
LNPRQLHTVIKFPPLLSCCVPRWKKDREARWDVNTHAYVYAERAMEGLRNGLGEWREVINLNFEISRPSRSFKWVGSW